MDSILGFQVVGREGEHERVNKVFDLMISFTTSWDSLLMHSLFDYHQTEGILCQPIMGNGTEDFLR